MNELIRNKGVCRTAMATSCLLIIYPDCVCLTVTLRRIHKQYKKTLNEILRIIYNELSGIKGRAAIHCSWYCHFFLSILKRLSSKNHRLKVSTNVKDFRLVSQYFRHVFFWYISDVLGTQLMVLDHDLTFSSALLSKY